MAKALPPHRWDWPADMVWRTFWAILVVPILTGPLMLLVLIGVAEIVDLLRPVLEAVGLTSPASEPANLTARWSIPDGSTKDVIVTFFGVAFFWRNHGLASNDRLRVARAPVASAHSMDNRLSLCGNGSRC